MSIDALQAWLPTMVAGGGIALIWYDVRRERAAWRKALYREDGTPIYMMRDECQKDQRECQAMVCAKIADMRAKLDAMDARREEQRNIIINQMMQLSDRVAGFSSQLQEYIRSHPV